MEEIKIDPDSYTPLYEQIRLKIMEQIQQGNWDDGQPLPSEAMFSEIFNVSRITIRRAVSEIVRSGYLVRKRGKGTFVRNPDVYYLTSGVHNFQKNAEEIGKTPRADVVTGEWLKADKDVAEKLLIPVGEKYFFIRLLRFLDDELIGWQTILASPTIGHMVDLKTLAEKQRLNPLLRIKGKQVTETCVEQGARLAREEDVDILGCGINSPILYSIFKEFGPDRDLYSYSEIAFRADKFKWVFTVIEK